MDEPVLSDPKVEPTDEVLAACLGRSKGVLDAALLHVQGRCPGAQAQWKYYRDGKSWLLSASWRKKTLFWLAAGHRRFRITFYLGPRAEADVLASAIPEEAKARYRESAGRKIRGVTLVLATKKDLAAFEELLELRLRA